MATIAYGTHTLAAHSTGGTYAIDKPTSLAEGDLLIAHIYAAGASITIAPPVGWTQLEEREDNEGYAVYAKVATALDAAASDFTFTVGGTISIGVRGALIRITSTAAFDVSLLQSHSTFDGSSTTTIQDTGITPNYSSGLYLILIGWDGGSGRTFGSYTFATDNPSWTELYDTAIGAQAGLVAAYSSRSSANATGTVSATPSGAVDNHFLGVVFVPQITIVQPTVVSMSTATYSVTVPTKVVEAPVAGTLTLHAPTVTAGTNPVTNTTKNAASVTNLDKS